MINCIRKELDLRRNFLSGERINTIYFGGGTPSILSAGDISKVLNDIYKIFSTYSKPEITLEANPDDLDDNKLIELRSIGINRLSIGVQSFHDKILKDLNRVHDSKTAYDAIVKARKAGFDNLNVDLIFAIHPGYFPELKKDMLTLKELQPEHLSTYCLTIESGTVFGNWYQKGIISKSTEDESANEFEFIIEELTQQGYDHYEISNFAKNGFHSIHNTSYWQDEKYLGIGPSAHSYDQIYRYHNISNNALYIKSIENDIVPESIDYLKKSDRINEYIMTSLRTKWGCNLDYMKNKFGFEMDSDTLLYIDDLISKGFIVAHESVIQLTQKGKLIADKVASDMFIS
jgi:oxygen-independent coproporphyrinogen-3 oxidase